jgi:hypothetical protein
MKKKLTCILGIMAILLLVGFTAQAQESQPSIEEQIKQKEAELERLREIKKRQDKVRELQDEIRRLEGGENVPPADTSQPGRPQPEPGTSTPTETAPQVESSPQPTTLTMAVSNATLPDVRPVVTRSLVARGGSTPTSDLPALRSCDVVNTLTDEDFRVHGIAGPFRASLVERYVCRTVNKIRARKVGNLADPKARVKVQPNPKAGMKLDEDFYPLMIVLLAREGRAQYVIDAENEGVDTQVSSDASSSGSTSLVTKGSVPAILGFAVDNGGLLKSTNGSTITFRGNVAGLAKALAGKGFISGYDEDSSATRFLRRTAFSFSFDASRGDLPGTFTGNKQQISNYSIHLDLYNKRDPRAARYREDWKTFLSSVSEAFVKQIGTSFAVLADGPANTWRDPALQKWYVLADSAVRNAKPEEVEAILQEEIENAPKDLASTTITELRNFDEHFKEWLEGRQTILDKIAKAPIVSFEYINDRPLNEPTLSKLNMIAELGFGPKLDLTFNGALTVFNKRPTTPGVNRVRDFQFATQLDVPFGELGRGMGKPVLSFAGRYERLMADATIAGLRVPNTQGDIGVGQVKLVIPIKNSGVRIPFSFSFANRSELIREKEVRGNFGFTFDLDTIFAKFKPF